jgi:type II secretory pathway component PulF
MTQFHWPGFDARRQLSTDEVHELAGRMAQLTRAGLPLGPGLRALAEELSGQRLPRLLHDLADRLDAGDDIAQAFESHGRSLPMHLRGLILAGVRSGRLAEVLDEFVVLQGRQSELRRRVWLSLAYPFVLLGLMAVLAGFVNGVLTPQFAKLFSDFNFRLPILTVFLLHESRPILWFFVGLVALSVAVPLLIWLIPGVRWIRPVLHHVPMVGPLLRWSHLARFARLMGLLLEQQVALPDALRVTADGLRDAYLAQGCRCVADDVEKGRALAESMASRRRFSVSLIPVIEWGWRMSALPDAFRAGAEMFESRVRCQAILLEAMALPIMFVVVIVFVGLLIAALLLPLLSLTNAFFG